MAGGRTGKGSGNSVILENVWADLTRNASNQSVRSTASARDKVAYERALPSPETNRMTESGVEGPTGDPSLLFLSCGLLFLRLRDRERARYTVARFDSGPTDVMRMPACILNDPRACIEILISRCVQTITSPPDRSSFSVVNQAARVLPL